MISHSVELLDGILCLLEKLVVVPCPNVRMEPVCVIGHGILAGKYLAEYRDSLK